MNLRQQRAFFTQAEFNWKDYLSRVREIEKNLLGQDLLKEFNEDLFIVLVERTRVKLPVGAVFVLKAEGEVGEVI